MRKIFTTILALTVVTVAFSQEVVFEENFDDLGADLRWNIGQEGASNTTDFVFDYITAGIAAAPNGGGVGLKFEVNVTEEVSSQVYAFPDGKSFSGHYILSFDLWLATDTSGSGTTEFALFGVMHTDELVPNSTGLDYAFTSENGSARDIRVFEEGIELLGSDGEGGYRLGPDGLPLQNMNLETGLSVYQDDFEGTMPFGQWLQIAVEVSPTDVIWTVNDSIWSSMPNVLVQAGNISIGYADWFSSLAVPAGSMFGLYDNIKVTQFYGVGVEEMEQKTVSVYPNPAREVLNVVVSERSSFEMINYLGQTVQRSMLDAGESSVNLSEIAQGIYFARFITENGAVEIHKVVVQ